ncbi:alpha/beta fold hydrolase [Mycoplasmoides pirum]|uniref:alpha/beta fold hydrolase n=1 Tax=Mycoplasmoides pirum TaxID=2122 RepID=UPI00047F35A2|nr:alpha/beta hydrolase [Mycoplasmoides pirum]
MMQIEKTIFDKNLEVYKYFSPKHKHKSIVIFCHGIAAAHHNFEPLIPYLGKYTFYQFTLPGHNNLPFKSKEINIESYAQKIYKWINENNFKNVILMGHSMGAAIVAKVSTMLDSRLVKGLILIAPYNVKCVNLKSAFAINLFLNLNFLKKYVHKYETNQKDKMNDLNLHKTIEEFIQFVDEHKKQINHLVMNLCNPKSLKNSSTCYKNISWPTYLILGENDVIVPTKTTEKYFKKIIPHVEVTIFKDTSHVLPIEIPKKFMNKINEIIQQLL